MWKLAIPATIQLVCHGQALATECATDFVAKFDNSFVYPDSTIRPFGTLSENMCVKATTDTVKLTDCADSTNDDFRWTYDKDTKQVKSQRLSDTSLCWTASNTRNARQPLSLAACNENSKLQRFKQTNGRVHMSAKSALCVSVLGKVSGQMTISTCQSQAFGQDTLSAASCSDSVPRMVHLFSNNGYLKAFKNDHSAGPCLFRQGSKAKFGKCTNKRSYKFKMTATGQIRLQSGNSCLTSSGTTKGGAATMKKCSNALKKKQWFTWLDGKIVLQHNPDIALQYNYVKAKKGKTDNAKFGKVVANVFGEVATQMNQLLNDQLTTTQQSTESPTTTQQVTTTHEETTTRDALNDKVCASTATCDMNDLGGFPWTERNAACIKRCENSADVSTCKTACMSDSWGLINDAVTTHTGCDFCCDSELIPTSYGSDDKQCFVECVFLDMVIENEDSHPGAPEKLTCVPDQTEQPLTCDTSSEYMNDAGDDCLLKQCTCQEETGTGASGVDCPTNGQMKCDPNGCVYGYHYNQNNKKCEENESYYEWEVTDNGTDGCAAPINYQVSGGADSPCIEGWTIPEGTLCTLRCDGNLAPSFATLTCLQGKLHPPGLLGHTFWTAEDHETGLFILCAEKDVLPPTLSDRVPDRVLTNNAGEQVTLPVKRGMSIWNHWQQDIFYKTYNPANVGWWFVWDTDTHSNTFKGRSGDTWAVDQDIKANSNFFPQWSWLYQEPNVVYPGSDYIGAFNEPYGDTQANMTYQEILDNWPRFLEKVQELADGRGKNISEIKIGSPTFGPGKKAMSYGEEFVKIAEQNGLRIDFMNIHSYTTGYGGTCTNTLQLRDEMSHLRFKWNRPIWLTEFNCGDGYWKNPLEDHIPYMTATLPMLEEHPWVVRYNWMSALAEYPGAELNDKTDKPVDGQGYELKQLGSMYNDYVWDGKAKENPQWGY